MDILVGEDDRQQAEIPEPLQAEAQNGSSPEVHHETLGTEETDEKISLGLAGRGDDREAFLERLLDDRLGRGEGTEAPQPGVIRRFNRFDSSFEHGGVGERGVGKVSVEEFFVGAIIVFNIERPFLRFLGRRSGDPLEKIEKPPVKGKNL